MSKKKVLIIAGIIVLLVVAIIIITLVKRKPNENNNNKDIYAQEEELFTAQSILSSFVLTYNLASPNELLSYLDSSYIEENQITLDNVENLVENYYSFPSYYVEKILVREDNNYKLYFVTGFITDDSPAGEVYEKYVNFLIITKDNLYSVRPLNSNQTIEDLKQNYVIDLNNISLSKEISVISNTDESKMLCYMSLFQKLLRVDPEKAFQYVETTDNYDSFLLIKDELYGKISYGIKEIVLESDNNSKVYNITLSNDEKITLIEKQVLDFKIKY